MIMSLIKFVRGVFPFVKEAFLWRDGAEVGKPITEANLIRRKIATYLLIGAMVFSGWSAKRLVEMASELVDLKKERDTYTEKILKIQANYEKCVYNYELLREDSHFNPRIRR